MYRVGKIGMRFRPFTELTGVSTRGYSRSLQRAVCDFGADHSFGKVNEKLEEHYGITLPSSAARKITEYHASKVYDIKNGLTKLNQLSTDVVIGESDGSMIPIVDTLSLASTDQPKQDRRKNKRLHWKEARLSLAHAKGSLTPYFAATMESVHVAGEQILHCVQQAGAHEKTKVHCVGDGAVWIADQVEKKFGSNGVYLIDFYHLCEYLSAAAPHCDPGDESAWLKKQKELMKLSQHNAVLSALKPHVEAKAVEEAQAPVRACYRYINNRPNQLDYLSAKNQDLPIGSGEVESAHRYVIQKRLKIAGAWWNINNAKYMIALRVARANNSWGQYWKMAA